MVPCPSFALPPFREEVGTDGHLLATLGIVSSWVCWPCVSYLGWEMTHGGETSIPRTSDVGVEATEIAGRERKAGRTQERPAMMLGLVLGKDRAQQAAAPRTRP